MSARPWPNPEQPGVPLNPEKNGWHWLTSLHTGKEQPWRWYARGQLWNWNGDTASPTPASMAKNYSYGGVCHTPAEVVELMKIARQETFNELAAAVLEATEKTNG
jgi:hypothetical protein